jgi:hypothetical protein
MKLTILALILAGVCNMAQAIEVTATGYGSSSDEALQNAKVLATEYAASTFVTGKQELLNGKYKETLGQYNGGLIEKFVVKSTRIKTGIYEVTILADVNADKINTIITTGNVAPNTFSSQLERIQDEYRKTAEALAAIENTTPRFGVVVDSSTYQVDDNRTTITYRFHVLWTPKWIDDVRQLAKAINRSLKTGWFSRARIDRQESVVCFNEYRTNQPYNPDTCFAMLELPDTLHHTILIKATIHRIDGTQITQKFYVLDDNGYEPSMSSDNRKLYRGTSGWQTPTLILFEKGKINKEWSITLPTKEIKNIAEVTFSVESPLI